MSRRLVCCSGQFIVDAETGERIRPIGQEKVLDFECHGDSMCVLVDSASIVHTPQAEIRIEGHVVALIGGQFLIQRNGWLSLDAKKFGRGRCAGYYKKVFPLCISAAGEIYYLTPGGERSDLCLPPLFAPSACAEECIFDGKPAADELGFVVGLRLWREGRVEIAEFQFREKELQFLCVHGERRALFLGDSGRVFALHLDTLAFSLYTEHLAEGLDLRLLRSLP